MPALISRNEVIQPPLGTRFDLAIQVGGSMPELEHLREAAQAARASVRWIVFDVSSDVEFWPLLTSPTPALGTVAVVKAKGDNCLALPHEFLGIRDVIRWAGCLVLPGPGDGVPAYLGVVRAAAQGRRPLLLIAEPEQVPEWEALWREVKGTG